MSQFSPEQALAICTANINSRVKERTNAYTLHYADNNNVVRGHISGFTVKGLIQEFSALGSSYRYAYITKKDDVKVIRFFNRDKCSKDKNGVYKFYSMTRKGTRKK